MPPENNGRVGRPLEDGKLVTKPLTVGIRRTNIVKRRNARHRMRKRYDRIRGTWTTENRERKSNSRKVVIKPKTKHPTYVTRVGYDQLRWEIIDPVTGNFRSYFVVRSIAYTKALFLFTLVGRRRFRNTNGNNRKRTSTFE